MITTDKIRTSTVIPFKCDSCTEKLTDADYEAGVCPHCEHNFQEPSCLIHGKEFNRHNICLNPEIAWGIKFKMYREMQISIAQGLDGWYYGYTHFNGGHGVNSGLNYNDFPVFRKGGKVEAGEIWPGYPSKEECLAAAAKEIQEYIEEKNHDGHKRIRPNGISAADWNKTKKSFYAFQESLKEDTVQTPIPENTTKNGDARPPLQSKQKKGSIEVPGLEHYFGGKGGSGTYQSIINYIPPHDVYIEPFIGSGAILRHKRIAEISIGVDKDVDVVDMWSAVITDLPISVSHGCGIELLYKILQDPEYFDSKDKVFIYVDPPYLLSTRTSTKNKGYKHQLDESDHTRLLCVLNKLSDAGFYIAISCYKNELYHKQLDGWIYEDFKSMSHGGPRIERLYMNYNTPLVLHDFSFLGENFRERERIRKKTDRHVQRLKQLPPLERNAILKAIDDSGLLRLRVFDPS